MLRSMYSGVSGLRSHQTMMDVVGNNIANVNTAGYKSSSSVFQDVLSQTLRAAGSPQNGAGGTNPAQVGLGTSVAAVSTNWGQGASQLTGRATDLAIQGDGFFAVEQSGETLYTRSGSFSFDANGTLVTPAGGSVQGWMAAAGAINTNAPLTQLRLPLGQALAPIQTAAMRLGGNLPADAPVDTTLTNAITVFDGQGVALPVTLTFTKTAANTWAVSGSMPTNTKPAGVQEVGKNSLVWDPAAKSFSPASMTLKPDASVGRFDAAGINVELGSTTEPMTQFAGASNLAALSQNGSAMGGLQSFTISPNGTLVGVFSNGLRESLGQIAMANFANPGGLEKVGGSLYRSSVNSGLVQNGTAGTAGRGTLTGGALEMSNVDLAQEFTNLIVAQRGFQANSKVISASDELLQDLVNLKR
ncbi:MAG: flagellar hook protein FlgE [Frankiales bacterium]|nr:flagellar hook protein FlgE [Frankiales bacterium]